MPRFTAALVDHARRGVHGAVAVAVVATCLFAAAGPAAPAAAATRSRVIDGPDVASYQHPHGARINWHKVARSGHEFAIIKATEGTFYRNPWFQQDYHGAHNAGLVRGSYHFARPHYPLVRSAKAQARYYVKRLGDSPTTARTLPPALDLETTGGLRRGPLVTWAQTFLLEARRLTGRIPLIYTYPYFWTSALGDASALARYPLWMASYGTHPGSTATLWQYTSRASVRGIRGSVDMSRLIASPESWRLLSDGRLPNPWPAMRPGSPQHVHATAGNATARVTWLPGDSGSSRIRSYVVSANTIDPVTERTVAAVTKTVSAQHFRTNIDGLRNGTAYTFTVRAANKRGTGRASDATGPTTPLVPVTMTVSAPSTRYGHDAHVHIRLVRTNSRHAISDRRVTVERRDAHGKWVVRRTLTTGSHGRTGLTLAQPRHNSRLRVIAHGPRGWQHPRRIVPVIVRSGVTAHLSRHHVRSGHRVTVRGHITPHVAGVHVRVQAYYRSSWHTLHRVRTTAHGAYVMHLRPRSHVRTTKYYRVVVAAFDGRSRGASAVHRVHVHRR